jgi:hypothetical protein
MNHFYPPKDEEPMDGKMPAKATPHPLKKLILRGEEKSEGNSGRSAFYMWEDGHEGDRHHGRPIGRSIGRATARSVGRSTAPSDGRRSLKPIERLKLGRSIGFKPLDVITRRPIGRTAGPPSAHVNRPTDRSAHR